MKKIMYTILILTVIFNITSCSFDKEEKYQKTIVGVFDTVTTLTVFTDSQEEFDRYYSYTFKRLNELNKLFDIYNNYPGINNIKTINDNAGIKGIKVNDEIINILKNSIEGYEISNGKLNIAMGSVLKIWHNYRTKGLENPQKAALPTQNELTNAQKYTNINSIKINEKEKTVYIDNPNTSIDVGATAKGYCCDLLSKELSQMGLECGLLNLGGNIKPIGNNKSWYVGIQSADSSDSKEAKIIDKVYIKNESIVSSGNYQRYYTVNGKNYSHIIDDKTLMPGENFKAVTVIHSSSVKADILSTTLFLLPIEEGMKLAKEQNAQALWILNDDSIVYSDDFDIYKKLPNQ